MIIIKSFCKTICASGKDYDEIYDLIQGVNEIMHEQCPQLKKARFDLADFIDLEEIEYEEEI